MKIRIARLIGVLMLIIAAGCAGQKNARYIEHGDMLPCELISLQDGAKWPCQVEFTSTLHRQGDMTAHNPASNESFTGEYRFYVSSGESSTSVVSNSWGLTTGIIETTSAPNRTTAKGLLRGDKGTVIDVSLDLAPVCNRSGDSCSFFDGQGTAADNHGSRYQIYFGYGFVK